MSITSVSKTQGVLMDLSQLKEMVPLFIAGMTTLGGGLAWMINRMDRKNADERKFELEERKKLEKFFTDQITTLQEDVHSQSKEIVQLRRELSVYVRHVGVLEGLLKSKGVEPPVLIIPAF